MTIFDVIAAIGGASGSLIGLMGMGIAVVEIFNRLGGGDSPAARSNTKLDKGSAA